jgi:peptide-methionine (S)-S-oxide reductase
VKTIDPNTQSICFGAGCFWSVEAAFQQLDFVVGTRAGYAGGLIEHPTYREVCSGMTGHADVVLLHYIHSQKNLERLLEVFELIHDPTFVYREKAERGSQYRSIVLFTNEHQKAEIEKWMKEARKRYSKKKITELQPLVHFYEAEEHHQNYYKGTSKNWFFYS